MPSNTKPLKLKKKSIVIKETDSDSFTDETEGHATDVDVDTTLQDETLDDEELEVPHELDEDEIPDEPEDFDGLDKDDGEHEPEPEGDKVNGVVKWFNDKSGFGYITVMSDGKFKNMDMFIHYKNIRPQVSTYNTLITGEYVTFYIGEADDAYDENNNKVEKKHKHQATFVTGFGGGMLMCDHNNFRFKPHNYRGGSNRNRNGRYNDSYGQSRNDDYEDLDDYDEPDEEFETVEPTRNTRPPYQRQNRYQKDDTRPQRNYGRYDDTRPRSNYSRGFNQRGNHTGFSRNTTDNRSGNDNRSYHDRRPQNDDGWQGVGANGRPIRRN